MRVLLVMLLVFSSAFADVCEDDRNKIEDKILWEFVSGLDEVRLCKALHRAYPQMKASECQVVKSTKTKRSEFCELLVGAYAFYGVKTNKNDCKYTQTNEYVKDIKNLPKVLKKYVFDIKVLTELSTPNKCVAISSAKYNKYKTNNDTMEKIKTSLKNLNDDNKGYLEFMQDEEMQDNALRIYSFIGDMLLKDFYGYYHEFNRLTKKIIEYDSSWQLGIEYDVINWEKLQRNTWAKAWTDNYVVKCYKKSPDDIININYGESIGYDGGEVTCKELKRRVEALGKVFE